MKINEKQQFIEVLTNVFSTYGKSISEGTTQIWWSAMERYEMTDVMQAFAKHVQNPDNGQFFPKPADLIRIIDGSSDEKALAAWSKVDTAIRRVGPYETVAFDDPVIHFALADMGGWMALCEKREDELPFVCNEFVKRYRGFVRKAGQAGNAPRLLGIFDTQNAGKGLPPSEPTLIGDREKAGQVHKNSTENNRVQISHLSQIDRPTLRIVKKEAAE